MSTTAYELAGRSRQKLRTRSALVSAARDLIAQGRSPTVEDAAEAAAVSRTTAYRYFANQAQLLAAAHPETEARSLLPRSAPKDLAARLHAVVERMTEIVLETEPQQRTMLRLSLEPGRSEPLLLRQGRAIAWIEEALVPLKNRLSPAQLRRLVLAIRTTIGIEALVWLTDVAGLSRKEAIKLMRWSASALLRGALAEGAPRRHRGLSLRRAIG